MTSTTPSADYFKFNPKQQAPAPRVSDLALTMKTAAMPRAITASGETRASRGSMNVTVIHLPKDPDVGSTTAPYLIKTKGQIRQPRIEAAPVTVNIKMR